MFASHSSSCFQDGRRCMWCVHPVNRSVRDLEGDATDGSNWKGVGRMSKDRPDFSGVTNPRRARLMGPVDAGRGL